MKPDKATKIKREQVLLNDFILKKVDLLFLQVSTLLPEKFREFDLRLYCKDRNPMICSIVRCAFRDYCKAKQYTEPKVDCED